MNEYFQRSIDHVFAELKRIKLKLDLEVMRLSREDSQIGDGKFRGLYVSGEKIGSITKALTFLQEDSSSVLVNSTPKTPPEPLHQLEIEIAAKKKESLRRGNVLRLDKLARSLGLSVFDIDVILVCLLPELELNYQRVYAYLQDDVTKKNPSVDFVLRLLCDSFDDRLKAREAFSPEAPLLKYNLLRLYDDHPSRPTLLAAKLLQLDPRITDYLLESDQIDSRVLPFTSLLHPKLRLQDMILPDDIKRRLTLLISQFKDSGLICYFQGSYGVGKRAIAEAVCFELNVPILSVDVNRMVAAGIPLELSVPLIFREGRLQNASLYLSGYDLLLSDEKEIKFGYNSVMAEIRDYPQWVFLAGERNWQPVGILHDRAVITIELTVPSYLVRRQLWEKKWDSALTFAVDVDFNGLASKFRLSGGQIHDAVAMARNLALWRAPEAGLITSEDIYFACRNQLRQTVSTLAHKVQPKYDWDDIVLPKDQMEQLREICSYLRHYYTVYGDWGFDQKVSSGKGLNVLFAGPSGTGKTMAAEIIANELGLDLYKIDLSAIVSKYIGETEKNLDRIFKDGQALNAILFFDEADALFGKRSEVRDSHDRYANIEIAYLLQKMDDYDGAVILATNLRKNMDEAFARRMHFAVEFPIPEEADRYRIWQWIFPKEAPLANDVDFAFLARQFKVSGGNIKNIALSAAFLAAQDGGCVTMENLIRATKREYQKMGRLCTEGDFASYFELVQG